MLIQNLTTTSASSSATYTYETIGTTKTWMDLHRFSLKIDVGGGLVTGQLFVNCRVGESLASGTTYVPVLTGSGTSILLSSTSPSIGGFDSNGSFYIPLTVVTGSGVTEFLPPVPALQIGTRAFGEDIPLSMWLVGS